MKHVKGIGIVAALLMAPVWAHALLDGGPGAGGRAPGLPGTGCARPGQDAEEARGLMAFGIGAWDGGVGYTPGNRRDPFRRWMITTDESGPRLPRWEEARLVGIMEGSGGERAAVFIDGPTGTGYIMREGMSFRDGGLHEIDAETGVVTVQRWTGQLPPVRRFVDIRLHPLEQETQ